MVGLLTLGLSETLARYRYRGGAAVYAMLCLLSTGCGYSEDEMQARIARIHELESELNSSRESNETFQRRLVEIEEQNAQLGSQLGQLGARVEGLQEERGNLETSLQETQRALDEMRARERQQAARMLAFRQLLGRFRSMIDSGQLRVRVVRNRMLIELSDHILFDSGRAELKADGQQALHEIAAILASIPEREFQVCGHTDSIPVRSRRFPSNWELSTARAVTVARFLSSEGVPEDRLSAAGYAATQPVASNTSPEGRQQNRRIEIVLMPNLDELPDLSAITQEDAPSSRPASESQG